MRGLTYSTTVIDDGAALQLSQFAKTNVREILRIFLKQVQALEDSGAGSLSLDYLTNATGWALEEWGKLFNVPRPSFGPAANDDDIYRAEIYAQIAVNRSHSTIDDILKILYLLNAQVVEVREIYPATIHIEYNGEPYLSGPRIRTVLERATQPIAIDLVRYEPVDAFTLAGPNSGLGIGYGILSSAY
jgi:hypothetical protein